VAVILKTTKTTKQHPTQMTASTNSTTTAAFAALPVVKATSPAIKQENPSEGESKKRSADEASPNQSLPPRPGSPNVPFGADPVPVKKEKVEEVELIPVFYTTHHETGETSHEPRKSPKQLLMCCPKMGPEDIILMKKFIQMATGLPSDFTPEHAAFITHDGPEFTTFTTGETSCCVAFNEKAMVEEEKTMPIVDEQPELPSAKAENKKRKHPKAKKATKKGSKKTPSN
jgi:hypothetical protein